MGRSKHSISRREFFKASSSIAAGGLFLGPLSACIDIKELGIEPGSDKDNTVSLQRILDEGPSSLYFSEGIYKIGTLHISQQTNLVFDPNAQLKPIPQKVTEKNLLIVSGNNVRLEDLHYDFAWNGAGIKETPVHNLIYADGVSDLFISGFNVENSDPRELVPLKNRKRRGRYLNLDGTDPTENYNHRAYYNSQCLVSIRNSQHIMLCNSRGYRLHGMIEAATSNNITVSGNSMVSGNYMTHFADGGENLRHHDNWSRDVKYQISWFGGSPDPSRKDYLPKGSSTVAIRNVKPGMAGYNRNTSGVYDLQIQNNYAEYGNTLAWGNKGRQVIIDSNVARFMADYAYGTEGGENIVFSDNISINSTSGGIVSMYWGEKILVTGNMIITRHEPWDPKWSWWNHPSKYFGPFVRLHHGPSNKEDRYGSGTVQINGNLLVNELSQRTLNLSVQGGRDVLVSSNKLVNGRVDKFGKGRLTVMNNEFVSRLNFDPLSVYIRGEAQSVIIKGNILRKEEPVKETTEEQKRSERRETPYFLFSEKDADQKNKGTGRGENMPAILLESEVASSRLVEHNTILGWKQAFEGQANPEREGATFLVLNNTADGSINVKNEYDPSTVKIENNTMIPSK